MNRAMSSIQDEVGVEIYPGTEVMKETEGHHLARSSGRSGVVLVPQPSRDPHDPLVKSYYLSHHEPSADLPVQNWSPLWKFSTMFLATATTFTQGFGPTALGPFFPDLEKSFDRNLPDVVLFTGLAILILGFSNFFWCVAGQKPYARTVTSS